MKLLTVTIPCYNSAAYMSHAVESVLTGGEEVEIIIVDDGSTDDTAKIADEYERKYPAIIRALHQENGGHGSAVNTGLEHAEGMFFKVIDSDDWVSEEAYQQVLQILREFSKDEAGLDMLLTNYVYEKVTENSRKVIDYKKELPAGCVFSWEDTNHFRQGHYILMHSVIYRTELLRGCGLKLPKHTFYVDNIFVYQPLPSVKRMYYLDVDFYRYFIGRDDQSVTEQNMIRRIDQQERVNRYMIDCCDVMALENKKLRKYMLQYLNIMMTVTSVYLIKEGSAGSLKKRDKLWKDLKEKHPQLYRRLYYTPLGISMNFKTGLGRWIVKVGYKVSKKIFKFG